MSKFGNVTGKTYRRAMEFILVLFIIISFLYRAISNADMLPSLPASENQIDDREWGKIRRMEFMKINPPTGAPTLKPVRPEKFWKFWVQRPRGIAA